MNTATRIAILATLILAGSAAHAEIYKWVDADGKTQFSDKPPLNQKNVKEVELKNTTVTPEAKAAAEQRAAAAKARVQNPNAPKSAAKGEDGKTAAKADDGKSELQRSEECYAQYRTTTGRLLPEAGEKCKEVKIP